MLKPKAYSRCRCHRATAVGCYGQRHLVEVVRHGNALCVVLCRGVGYRPRLPHLLEGYARNDIYSFALGSALQGTLQRVPNSAIERVLYLRNGVGNIECLQLHSLVSVARGVWNKVSARVAVVVGVTAEIYLILRLYLGVIRPFRWARERPHMFRLQRICHPHRGIGRFVVVGGVVTLATRLNLHLHRIWIERVIANCRQLEPTFAWFCCSLGRVRGRTLIFLRVRGRRGYFPSCSTTRVSISRSIGYC